MAYASRKWPVTCGTVVGHKTQSNSESHQLHAVVSYEFMVGPESCLGNRVKLIGLLLSPRSTRRVFAKYPIGSEVSVSYHPRLYRKWAVLEPGWDGGATLMLCVAVFFGVCSVVLWFKK